MFAKCSFDKKENKLDYYRRRDCIQKLCKKLKERATKIINYKEKRMTPLTAEEKSLTKSKTHVIYVKEISVRMKMMRIIKIKKRLEITVITQENLEELLIAIAI